MDTKNIQDEYKQLCMYIEKIDKNIRLINREASEEIQKSMKLLFRMYNILSKKELTDDDLNLLAQSFNSSFFELGKSNQTVFNLICYHVMKEQEKNGIVRDKLFQLLQTVISKEDFSIFDLQENISAFENLYISLGHENIDFLAIFYYLTSQGKLRSMVNGSISRNGLAETVDNLNEFCYFLEKNDEKIYIYR